MQEDDGTPGAPSQTLLREAGVPGRRNPPCHGALNLPLFSVCGDGAPSAASLPKDHGDWSGARSPRRGRCRTQPLNMACRCPSQRSVPPDARAPLLVSLSASVCTWPCARLAQDSGLYGVGSWRCRGICCGLLTAVLVSCCEAASPVECAAGPLSTLSTSWLLVSRAVGGCRDRVLLWVGLLSAQHDPTAASVPRKLWWASG